MVFQNTPDTEAPVEMNTYFPQFKAFWAAENVTGTIHNIYTLRGARVRNALNWSKEINVALYKFGQEAEVMFASHSWPRWGNARIQEVLRAQRDAYANLNNQALHYANRGVTINEIHNVYEVPKSLQQQWAARSYHGDVQNNVARRDQPLPRPLRRQPGQPDPAVAEGLGAALRRDDGRLGEDHGQGQGADRAGQVPAGDRDPQQAGVRRAAEPGGPPPAGRRLRATRLPGREHQRAQHLPAGRVRAAQRPARRRAAASTGPDVVRAMSTEQWLDFVGISMDPKKAEGMRFVINLVTPDNGEKYVVEMSNATLTNIKGEQAKNPDLTITSTAPISTR